MKTYQRILTFSALTFALAIAVPARAADTEKKPKPYPLDKCVVSDEKIGGDPDMKPHVFIVDGQEVKLCCKSCLKDFNKDKAGYMKKIADAQKKPK
jgi:hypothetical protein